METHRLEATHRKLIGKRVKKLRGQGKLPAVIYGGNVETTPIAMEAREAARVLRETTSSSLLTIDLEGQEYTTLVRERQREVITGELLHVDFQVVSLTEKINAKVNVVLEGESPAVKEFGAILVTSLDQLEVLSLPQDLPEKIEVDVSSLENIGDGLYVRDLDLPSEVEVLEDLDELVVVVAAPAQEEIEEEEEELITEEMEPEVVGREGEELAEGEGEQQPSEEAE